ncbi:asparagine synthase, partial [Candidatus Woesearchaeota archaeon]|nr:asparagine synthase [Candidatus Woesearchaeota archaeon]
PDKNIPNGTSGINRLLPGHILSYKDKQIKTNKYWDLDFCPTNEKIDYYVNNLRSLIEDSVKKRLMSEVPLGIFLSGGIDSTAILSYANEFSDKQIKTFNLSFCDWPDNELKYTRIASNFFNTDHDEIIVKPEIIKVLPKVIWHMDEPVADPTAVLNYVLAERASKSVKVVLTGEGADEIFAGYEQYKIMNLAKSYDKIVPKFVQKGLIQRIINLLPKENFFMKLSNYLSTINNTPKSYVELLSIFDKSEKEFLYSEDLTRKIGSLNSDLKSVSCYFKNSYDMLNKMLLSDIKTWLPNNMLIKLDRMSMAHSIEARVPFLDHRIVEFSSKVPPRLKLKGLNEKFILKKAMIKKVPKEIIKRKKQRFFV